MSVKPLELLGKIPGAAFSAVRWIAGAALSGLGVFGGFTAAANGCPNCAWVGLEVLAAGVGTALITYELVLKLRKGGPGAVGT